MSDLKASNFRLKKFKKTNAGIEVIYEESIVISEDVVTVNEVVKKSKDSPDPELVTKLQELSEIVRYDEGYSDDVEVKITGVSISGKDEDIAIITHSKRINSGMTGGRNSCRISQSSEDFEKADKLFEIIDELNYHVYQFVIKNKRSQLELFNAEDSETEEKSTGEMEVA